MATPSWRHPDSPSRRQPDVAGESWTGEDEMAAGQELAALEAELLDEEVLALPKVPTTTAAVPGVVPGRAAAVPSQPQAATAERLEEPLPG